MGQWRSDGTEVVSISRPGAELIHELPHELVFAAVLGYVMGRVVPRVFQALEPVPWFWRELDRELSFERSFSC